jgi:hypothetical protein
MFDADWLGPLAAWVDGYEDGIPLVNIASDNVSHEKLLLKSWRSIAAWWSTAALSYDHA